MNKSAATSSLGLVRIVLCLLLGFVLGFFLVGPLVSGLANAQTKMNQPITLTTYNSVVLRGPIDSDSVTTVEQDLITAVSRRGGKNYPIYLVIDSPGGDIIAGLSFIEFAKTIPNLSTVSMFSASMASAIVEALPGERLVTQNGILMFHRAQGGFQGYFENGEVESRLGTAKAIVQFMERNNASRMKMTIEDYKRLSQSELWLFGDDALSYRSADKTVDVTCTKDLLKQMNTVNFSGGPFGLSSVSFVFSGCPLFRTPFAASSNKVGYIVPSFKDYRISNLIKLD